MVRRRTHPTFTFSARSFGDQLLHLWNQVERHLNHRKTLRLVGGLRFSDRFFVGLIFVVARDFIGALLIPSLWIMRDRRAAWFDCFFFHDRLRRSLRLRALSCLARKSLAVTTNIP